MDDGSIFTEVLVPLGLAFIMVGLGLSLTVTDFRRVFVLPRGVLIGLANLLVVSPLLAFTVAEVFGLAAALAVGLVLLGASPGGTTANMLTHLARGDVALSVTMTAISSVAAVVTVPLYLGLAIDHFGSSLTDDVNMVGVVIRVLLITIVPLALGMWLRATREQRVLEVESRVKRAALIAFVIVVALAVASEFEELRENFAEVAAACLALNVLAMTISYSVARLAKLDDRQSTAIAMELGVHNATLAIAVATSIATVLTIPAAVYSAFMFLTAGVFARLMYHRNGGADAAATQRAPGSAPAGSAPGP